MSYLALIIALALQQVVSANSVLFSRVWLERLDDSLADMLSAPGLRLALTLLLPLALAFWILGELDNWAFALPALAASVLMLLWSLGNDDYHTALERFVGRVDHDPAGAGECLDVLWMPDVVEDGDAAQQRLVYAGFSRWFPPVLYFVLAGPLAAFAYRIVASLVARDRAPLGLLGLLDWLPSRVLSVSFALTGDFLAVMAALGHNAAWSKASASQLLVQTASAACGEASGLRGLADLLYRCAGLWILALSLAFLFL
jgi:AmpE protein